MTFPRFKSILGPVDDTTFTKFANLAISISGLHPAASLIGVGHGIFTAVLPFIADGNYICKFFYLVYKKFKLER